jgi:hypothetical protein
VRRERAILPRGVLVACAVAACALAGGAVDAGSALAQSTWRLEQPDPPPAPAGVAEAPAPVGLGRVGDIEFFAPDLGVLTTAGNPPTIPPGVWIYDGQGWHELAEVCGATAGRIAWVSAKEFWTVSNGRPGQAVVNGKSPPLEDDTLCRFADGQVVESFAAPAFEADSYQAMHAAACLSGEDCWFAGGPLPDESPEIGAFQLRWNGSGLGAAPYLEENHTIEDMRAFDGRLYESVRVRPPCTPDSGSQCDRAVKTVAYPPVLHVLDPEASGAWAPERRLGQKTIYEEGESASALEYLRLSAGAGALWAAAGQRLEAEPLETKGAQATVLRYTPEAGGRWTQLLGPKTDPSGASELPQQTVEAIAAESGTGEEGGEEGAEEGAWLALQTIAEARNSEAGTAPSSSYASVARVSEHGVVSQQETLPSASEGGVGPKGAAYKIACPAPGDCWMVTAKGWLFHLAPEGERTLAEDPESGFTGGLITERPEDKGLPQQLPDALPPDDSGLAGEAPPSVSTPTVTKAQPEARVPVALVSGVHSRIVHGTTLELRLRLAVEARIELVAKRKRRVVAKTPTYTLKAGEHRLLLLLSRTRWPTELHLVEHALAPLPTVSAAAGSSETLET